MHVGAESIDPLDPNPATSEDIVTAWKTDLLVHPTTRPQQLRHGIGLLWTPGWKGRIHVTVQFMKQWREYLMPWRSPISTFWRETSYLDDPDKEVLACELLERLVIRCRGEIQDELGDLNKKFTDFVIKPEEKVCTGIDRLNGIVQKLTQHDQLPTDAAKLSKLKTALEKVPLLNQLWLTVSLSAYMTYDEVVATCKRYDKAMDLQRSITSGEKVYSTHLRI